MALRVTNLRASLDEVECELPARFARALRIPPADIQQFRILRKSLDTRDKHDIAFVYSAEIQLADEEPLLNSVRGPVQVERYVEPPFELPEPGPDPLPHRPVVVGSGPGGLAAAYFLAERGYRPLLLERGPAVSQRIRDVKAFDSGGAFLPESNYLFGDGGAGTFCDGKLT